MLIQLLASLIVTTVVLVVVGQILYVVDKVSIFFARQQAIRGQAAAIKVMEETNKRVKEALREVEPSGGSVPIHPSTFEFYEKMIHPELFLLGMGKEEFNAWIDNAIDPPTKKDLEALEKLLIECEMYEHCAWLKERNG